MVSRFRIQVPAIAIGSGLTAGNKISIAADHAATQLLNTPVIDWLGKEQLLRDVADRSGIVHEIEFATRQLFMALVSEQITYRDYRNRMRRYPLSVSEDTKRAVHYYHHVFARNPELQTLGLGDGSILLARLNILMEGQIGHPLTTPSR